MVSLSETQLTHQAEQTQALSGIKNPLHIRSLSFIEFTGPNPDHFDKIFKAMGCSKLAKHPEKSIFYYSQNDIHFLVNQEPQGFEANFGTQHGQSACSIGLWVDNAQFSYETAIDRGAKAYDGTKSYPWPAIYGVGDSLVYFVDGNSKTQALEALLTPLTQPERVEDKGFQMVDHMTNNVEKGKMGEWVNFYETIFGFTKIQYFDIRGLKTGLTSFALKSPCRTFSIPINEASDEKSQIAEFLRDYNGAGIQHIALSTPDLLNTLDRMEDGGINTLDMDEDYYVEAFQRVPQVTEDRDHIKRHQVLIDGDAEGYLLQIFTQNLFGPIFFEFIQRKNHFAFGEGNFGALFKSIERDQERRGVL